MQTAKARICDKFKLLTRFQQVNRYDMLHRIALPWFAHKCYEIGLVICAAKTYTNNWSHDLFVYDVFNDTADRSKDSLYLPYNIMWFVAILTTYFTSC